MKTVFKKIVVWLLTLEAKAVLKKYKPHVVAVTGSVGKTSTKDAVFSMLGGFVHARKSEKSFNSEIGVPLTILGLHNAWSNPLLWAKNLLDGLLLLIFKQEYPEWLVLEVGADRPGDIQSIASWLACDVVVLTRLPDVPVHVEFFDSPEDVIKEKKYLLQALKPDGVLIINADDEKMTDLPDVAHVLSYGFNPKADIQGKRDRVAYRNFAPKGMAMHIVYSGQDFSYELNGVLGRHHLYPTLAACAVASALGLDFAQAVQKLSEHTTPPGRMRILKGKNSSTIIDDTYNASPVATAEALTALSQVQVKGRKIVALGDMLELGQYTKTAHEAVGEHAARVAQFFYTVGVRSRVAADTAVRSGMKKEDVTKCDDARALGVMLSRSVQPGDIILVKGSQSVRMERVVEALLEDPSQKKNLLVRQEDEWQRR